VEQVKLAGIEASVRGSGTCRSAHAEASKTCGTL